jgi:hypothetical protein
MKANEDKLLENLVDTIMKDFVMETPMSDFTTKVMSQVFTTKNSEVYVYKPLISKYVFILVFGCFITLFFYLEPQKNSWISSLGFGTFYYNYSSSLFNFSKITVYSVVLASLMLFVQILFLRKYFDSRFEK